MFKKAVFVGLLVSTFSLPVYAESSSKEESAGIGLGAVIGAVTGGPVGLIVGAALGAKVGGEMHERGSEVESLTASLDDSRKQVVSLEENLRSLDGEIRTLDGELREAREFAKPELITLLAAGIEMDLLFRTAEDTLSVTTTGKLGQLAASLVTNTDIQIRLDGFADERGDAGYNQELSVRRAEHVRDLLVATGINTSRISINAHGESPAAEMNVDSFALERRVSMTIFVTDAPSVAATRR
ncbi:MAG: OmpA family protein [Woeseia sp.]|jgi:outer membrane protein OmpA-like peptidoglycan-associated protein|nr:OmpA family protein [Woeseia sp.]MBT6210408.1 OmpA family protein [Woeseia sp.]